MSTMRRSALNIRQLVTWLVLSVGTGILTGFAAVFFDMLLEWATAVSLGGLAGHRPLGTEGASTEDPAGILRPWALPLVTAGGAFVAALVTLRWCRGGGHGMDSVIRAAQRDPGGIGVRTPVVKLLSSALTIGSGGSAGTEGPIGHAGGALGSFVARTAGLPPQAARVLVLTGVAGGIGALFKAPLGASIVAAELLRRRGFSVIVLPPALVAAGTAWGVFGLVRGADPMFGGAPYGAPESAGLLVFVLLGLVCGLLGRSYAATLHGVSRLTAKLTTRGSAPPYLLPTIGGFAVGLVGITIPGVLGTGYGFVAHAAMSSSHVLETALWLVLVLPVAKIAATSLTVGSGGSGGVFGPGLVIGAAAGSAVWRLTDVIGLGVTDHPGAFVLAGMAACLGPVVQAPLGVTVLVFEATQNVQLLLPTALAVGISWLVVGEQTLYPSQQPASSCYGTVEQETRACR